MKGKVKSVFIRIFTLLGLLLAYTIPVMGQSNADIVDPGGNVESFTVLEADPYCFNRQLTFVYNFNDFYERMVGYRSIFYESNNGGLSTFETGTSVALSCDATIDFGDGSSVELLKIQPYAVQHKYILAGVYVATITMNCQGTGFAQKFIFHSLNITIGSDNCGQLFDLESQINCPNLPTTLYVENSYSEMAITNLLFDFGDGTTANVNSNSNTVDSKIITGHNYAQVGVYLVRCTVCYYDKSTPTNNLYFTMYKLVVVDGNCDLLIMDNSKIIPNCEKGFIICEFNGGASNYLSIISYQIIYDYDDGSPPTTDIRHNIVNAKKSIYKIKRKVLCTTIDHPHDVVVYYMPEIIVEFNDCPCPSCNNAQCQDCVPSFAPIQDKKYVLSAWVKEDNSIGKITYPQPKISLQFDGVNTQVSLPTASGPIIDGWQRLEGEFTVPDGATKIHIQLGNSSTEGNSESPFYVYFDDIRIYPAKANMKSYVYDPVTLRLMAELDENNFATLYEYDEEGKLVRVKKETERGVKTIQETFNNIKKSSQ